MLADALEHLVRGIVDHPDDVTVRDKQLRRGSILEVRVHPDDLGKVIGRSGRTASAFRTVISALAGRGGARMDLVDVDRRRGARHTLEWVPSRRGRHPFCISPLCERELVSDIEVVVGRIGKPHGIRGEVTVDVRTDEPERRFAVGTTLRAAPPAGSASPLRSVTVSRTRWHQGVLLAHFEEIGDRNAAEAARGIVLHATLPVDATPEDPEEFYDHQLIGLTAVDLEGRELGEVSRVVHGGAQDLLQIRTPDRREALVPFVAALVPEVDVAGGRVVVADRPGLVTPFEDES